MFRCLFRVTGAKKPLPAKDRGADDKGCEGRRAQKSLPRIAGDIAFPRRNKGNRLKCGAGRTLPGNEPEGRVTKKGYNRICFRVHLYALICSCNLLKSKTGRRMTASFHAVDRGSNPLGDANAKPGHMLLLLGCRSIGRTADSGSANQGSSPCSPAITTS